LFLLPRLLLLQKNFHFRGRILKRGIEILTGLVVPLGTNKLMTVKLRQTFLQGVEEIVNLHLYLLLREILKLFIERELIGPATEEKVTPTIGRKDKATQHGCRNALDKDLTGAKDNCKVVFELP